MGTTKKCLSLGGLMLFGALAFGAGREIAANYDISLASETGGEARVALSVRLNNTSSEDVLGATLVIRSKEDGKVLGTAYAGTIRARGSVKLRTEVVVSKAAYEAMENGAKPELLLQDDNGGNKRERVVESAFRFRSEDK